MLKRIGKFIPFVIGALLLYSGVYKLVSPGEATLALKAMDLPIGLARWTIVAVTALELYLGVLLVGRSDLKFSLAAATVLMFAFTVFLWFLSTLAHPPSCGCLGLTGVFTAGKRGALLGIARNCVLLWLLKLAYDYYSPRWRANPAETGAPVGSERSEEEQGSVAPA